MGPHSMKSQETSNSPRTTFVLLRFHHQPISDPMRSKTAAQLKQMIKYESEIYTSLLCQHASEEGKHLSCSPAFRFLTNIVQLSMSYQYSPALTSPNHSLLSLGSYSGNDSALHVPSIDAAYINVPLSCGPQIAWK